MRLFLSICFAENIGLKGLYLNDDIGSACEQLKKLSVQILIVNMLVLLLSV